MALKTITLAVAVIVGLALCCTVLAGDVYVDAAASGAGNGSSWDDAFTTIQAAIDSASPGDVVYVAAGAYVENIDFKGKAITLTSTDPLDPAVVAATVIDGGGLDSVVTFNSQESATSVLTGFTIQNGTGTLVGGVRFGGGIYCGAGSSPTIRRNRIINCSADVGGAIYSKGNTAPVITDGPAAAYPYVGKGRQVGLSVTATDVDNDTLTYTWTPLDGGSISGSGASVNYSATTGGPHHIRVTVSDDRGGSVQGECTVTVIGIDITTPLPQLVVGETSALLASLTPDIADTPEYPVTITWSLTQGPAAGAFDAGVNGTPGATTIDFTPTASGPGTIQAEYKVGTAAATDTVAILLNPIIDSVSPRFGVIGTTVQPMITGKNLGRVTGIALSPGTGVTGSIRAGQTEDSLPVEFVISGAAAPGNRTILLDVPEGQVNTGATFEIRTPPAITPDPTTLNLLTGGAGNITFSVPDTAPAGGLLLTLSSSAPVVATVPPNATIPEGQSSVAVTVSAVAYGQTTITANATGYYRAQVPVTVINPPLISFMPSPLNVAQGLVEKCTVSVTNPAPAGGLTVSLAGGEGLVTYPASVVIPEAQFSRQFNVEGVAQGSATITASAAGYPNANLTVNVGPAQLNLFPSYLPIAAGRSSTLQLSIPNNAPAGGLVVNIESSNTSVVTVPATVTIAEGQKSAPVAVNGVIPGQATVSAGLAGFNSAQATVNVLSTFNISFLPGTTQMPPGVTRQVDVVISSAAPAGGLTITLSNPSPDKVSVPDTVVIDEGTFAKTISITGLDPSGGPVTITASCPGLTDGTLQVTVQPLLSLYFRADVTVGVRTQTTGAVGLTTGAAPAGGYTVNVSVDDPTVASVPAQVTIPAGSSWTSFTIVGLNPGSTTCRLTLTGYSDADTLTCVAPTFTWNNVPSSLMVGQTQSVRVFTYVPGGTYAYSDWVYNDTTQNVSQAVTVSAASSDPAVATIPATMTVPAGRYYADYVTLSAVGPGTTKLTASADKFTSVESSTVTVTEISIYFRADVTVGDGCRTTGAVGITSGAAPAGGYTVSLSSDAPSIASVPAQVTIPAGGSWASFDILGVSIGSTQIHVTAPSGYTEADTCTVVKPTFTWNNVPSSLSLGQTQSVRVYNYVPGGTYAYGNYIYSDTTQNIDQALTINVASSNNAVITVPATMSIPAGRYYADYVTVTAAGAGTAHLTAGATDWTSVDSSDITVTGVTPYFRADVTVGDGCRTTGSIGLSSGSAPAGGYTFNLQSLDPSIATVPATVTIPAGNSWNSFNIVGVSPGTTTIRLTSPAEYGGYTEEDTVTVVTPTFTWNNVPASLLLGQTQSVRVYNYVPGGTYAYGNYVYSDTTQNVDQTLTVNLASSDPAVISAPATMNIPGGRYYADYVTITAAGAGTAHLAASATDWTSVDSSDITVTGVTPYFRADVAVGLGCYTTGSVGLNSGAAPTGGYIFNLSSDDPSIASVPATVTIPAGSSWNSFRITGNNIGSTTIRITAPGGYTEGDTCNVVTPTFQWQSVATQLSIGAVDSVRVYSRVVGGTYAAGNWVYGNEYQDRASALTANLASSNSGVIQVPATTTIPVDRYYSDYFNMSAVGAGSSTLTASATGYTDGVSDLITIVGPWMRADVTVGAGCRTTGYVGLTGGVAPTGGYTVNLTVDDPSIIGVPATVTIPAGYSQINFYIQGLTAGSTYTQMSVSGFIDRDQTTVVTPTFEWYGVASSVNVGANDSVYVQTYVPGGTYASGNWVYSLTYQEVPTALTVAISSEDPSVLSAPATVNISAGNYWTGWFNMTGVSVGTSKLTASATGWIPAQTGIVTVTSGSAQDTGIRYAVGEHATAQSRGIAIPNVTSAVPTAPLVIPTAVRNPLFDRLGSQEKQIPRAARNDYSPGHGGPMIAMLPAMAVFNATGDPELVSTSGARLQGFNSGPAIEYNVISGNTATAGGGLAVNNSTVTVLGNIFAANTATSGAGGGAIHVTGTSASVTIKSNTISANVANSGLGGGIYRDSGTVSITNCILWENGDDLEGCSATYSDVTDLGQDPGAGNVSLVPGFLQTADPFAGDYHHIGAGSPLVNAGNAAYSLSPGETDIDGQARIANGRVDIGADEVPDTTPPETSITSGPAEGASVCADNTSFTFTGSDNSTQVGNLTYTWRLDGGAWQGPTSSTTASLTGLAEGLHTFEVAAIDQFGNQDPTPAVRHFTVVYAAPAVVSGVTATPTDVECAITYTTDIPVATQVAYGTTTSYGSLTPLEPVPSTSHTAILTGLTRDTTYHYRVSYSDACGNPVTSTDRTFKTMPGPPVSWVNWTSGTSGTSGHATGALTFGATTVDVTYNGEIAFIQTSGGTNYWNPSSSYISQWCGNAPPASDIIALSRASAKTLTFSEAISGLLFAVVSLNGNGYRFDRDFDILSHGCGYWGCGTLTKQDMGDGTFQLNGSGEPHGVIRFKGAATSITWTSLTNENWNGFTVGTYGVILDTATPDTQITSTDPAEGATVCVDTATIQFTGVDDVTPSDQLRYEWRLDNGAWSARSTQTSQTLMSLGEGPHVFEVAAVDWKDKVDDTPAVRHFFVDTVAPSVSGVSVVPTTSTCIISWTTNEPATTQVLYGTTLPYDHATTLNPALTIAHTATITGLNPGSTYHYGIISDDACPRGPTPDSTFSTLPDITPPETQIDSGPSQGSTACSLPVNFSWHATDDTPAGITYSHRIDGESWSSWAAGASVSYPSLDDGPHTFEVKAKDSSGNEDPTPAKRDFQLNTAAPVISETAANAGRTSAIVTWTTDQPSTSQVLYGLTDALGQATYTNWVMVTSHNLTVSNLSPSTTYHYRVKSRDNCGRESTSDDQTFTTAADTTPPDTQVTSGPSEGSTACNVPVDFAYTGTDDSSPTSSLTYAHRVDGGAWSTFDVATTASIGGLASGDHTFEVKARDTSGNEDASPAVRNFKVRLDPPVVSSVQSSVAQMQCTITWTTDQPSTSQVEYGETTAYGTLSPVNYSMVTSHGITLSGLSPSKTYHYIVHSKDSCNRDGVSGDQTFVTPADTGEPNTWFTGEPSEGGRVCSNSRQFCWSGNDTITPTAQLVYSYKLDSGVWSTPTAETCRTFTSLAEGGHTLYVRAHDTSGNVDSTPAERTFTVDLSTGTVYNVNSAAGSTEATVVWSSSEPMDSQVEYGLTTSYGATTTLSPSLVTDHTVVVPGLAPDTTYNCRVKSKDGCGREAVSTNKTFKTAADQNAPQTTITSGPPDSGKACATTVDLCWTGSDNATPTDQLVYSYRMDNEAWGAWTTEVCRQFTGLAEGLHTFTVKAKDTVGNEDVSPAVRYFYVDLTAPTISPDSISNSPKQSTCIINWRTGEPATAQVEYGVTPAYGKLSTVDSNMLTAHKITLSGLTPETTYHYRVKSSDGCRDVVSDDQTFTTQAVQPPNLRPTQLTVPISTSAHATIKISWVIQNVGPGDAEGAWTDKLYFSEDETIDAGDTVLWQGAGSSPMPVPYTYSKQVQVEMPMKLVGAYYVILKADDGEALAETNETDNVFAQPVVFTADKPLIAAPENINIRLDPQVAAYGQFDLSNIGSAKLTGITAQVDGAAANITLGTSNVVPEMDPLTNRRISYQVTASDESVLTNSPTVTFTTNEGASATMVFNLTVTPRQPKIVANPGYMSGPMVRGQQTFYECEITNQGGVPATDLRVLLPSANWLSLVTPADLGTIGPGEKKTVGLSLTPPSDMALGDYASNFVVVGSNSNVSVSFRFTCISIQTGSIKVWAEDEFTAFAEDHPYVSGATVTLKDYITGEVKYQGVTGEDGIWLKDPIVEANYYLEVAAPKHGTYRSPIQIIAGQLKEVHAFIPRQLVTYTWTVEPIQIEDKYRVVLEATFETHVPAPVVTIEPRTQVAPVVEGQTAVQYVTVTNHGLIAAHEVEVNIGDTENWYVTPGIRNIGELPPLTSVVVPVYIRSKADGPITDIPQVATSTMAAEAAAARVAAMAAREGVTPNDGGGGSGGQPSLCDILNGKVVHVVYCSGGQWKTADFSISPLKILLNLLDALGCVGGNIQSCLSLACDLAQIDPCICFFMDPLSAGGALSAAQCLACHGFPGGGGGPGPGGGPGGGWGGSGWPLGPGGISGPSGIEEGIPCDPATKPQTFSGALSAGLGPVRPNVLITSPPDIAKYGGKLVRYRVNLFPSER